MARCSFTMSEDMVIIDCFNEGNSDVQIVAALKRCGFERSEASVANRRRKLNLLNDEFRPQMPGEERADCIAADEAFRAAMTAAIEAGSERAKFGIVKDESPLVGKMIHPEPIFSGCTSSAGLCAELGTSDTEQFIAR